MEARMTEEVKNTGIVVKLAFLLNITYSISFSAWRAIHHADSWSNEGPIVHLALHLVFSSDNMYTTEVYR